MFLFAGPVITVASASEVSPVDSTVTTGSDTADSETAGSDIDEETQSNDTLSLPAASAPVAIASAPQSTAPVGRNTSGNLSPPPGAQVNANLGFFPSLTLSVSKRNNPTRINGGEDQDDISWTIVPVLTYRGLIRDRHVYELGVSASQESFDELVNLDNDSYNLNAAIRLDLTEILKLDVFGDTGKGSDKRGGTATRLIPPDGESDRYDQTRYGGRVTLGRRSNPLQLVFGAEHLDLEFTNNDQGQRDRQDTRVESGIFFNVSPRTSLFLNAAQTDIDYEQESSGIYDSTNTTFNAGIGWDPSYSTSLLFEAGQIQKDFADSTLEDQDSDSYRGKLTWLPTLFTSFNVYASRTFEETTVRDSPVTISDLFGVSLSHAFTSSIRGQAYYNLIDDELVDARLDEITDYGIGVSYDLNRYLSLGLFWDWTRRESTDPLAAYETDAITLFASIKPVQVRGFGEPEINTTEDLRGVE